MQITINKVNYAIRFKMFKRFWFECWLPAWDNGRGRYVTIGLYFVAFYRGY